MLELIVLDHFFMFLTMIMILLWLFSSERFLNIKLLCFLCNHTFFSLFLFEESRFYNVVSFSLICCIEEYYHFIY